MYLPHADRLRLYRQFKAIRPADFQGIVSFYEMHESLLQQFEFDAWFDCTLVYCQALFDAGHYGKHVVMCDYLLQTIIRNNILHWGGEDWYVKILQQKARSLGRLGDYKKAEHILQELIKMYPFDRDIARWLLQMRLRTVPSRRAEVRAILVVLVLLIVGLMSMEVLALPAYPRYLPYFQSLHNGLAGVGMVLLFVSEWVHWEKCRHSVQQFVQQARMQKTSNCSSNS